MRKTPKCKNCGGYHYTYQCWSKPKRPCVKKVSKSRPSTSSSYERQKLIKELDKAVSLYVRQKGMDKFGYNTCYTCGARLPWRQLDCGHYIKRRYLQTRWELNNVRPQCQICNRNLNGNYKVYEPKIRQELGTDFVQKMWDKALSGEKISTPMLEVILQKIQEKYKNLQKPS